MLTTLLSLRDLINDFDTLNEGMFDYTFEITESFPKFGEHTYQLDDLHITLEDEFIYFNDSKEIIISSERYCVLSVLTEDVIKSITLVYVDDKDYHDYIIRLIDGTIRIRIKVN